VQLISTGIEYNEYRSFRRQIDKFPYNVVERYGIKPKILIAGIFYVDWNKKVDVISSPRRTVSRIIQKGVGPESNV
jgi:hypothetical protein